MKNITITLLVVWKSFCIFGILLAKASIQSSTTPDTGCSMALPNGEVG